MKTKDNLGLVSSFFYTCILFLVVFNPPIYANVSFTVMAVIVSVFILLKYRKISMNVVGAESIRQILRFFIFFFVYYLIIAFVNYTATSNVEVLNILMDTIVSYFSFFLVSIGIVVWSIKKRISFNNLGSLYIQAGIIQIILVFICLVSPSIKFFLNETTRVNASSELIINGMTYSTAYRNYGFASSLNDIFGFTMAILGVITLSHAIKGRQILYLVSLAFAVSAVVNARSAFIIYMVGFMIMLLSRKGRISIQWLSRVIIMFTLVGALVAYAFNVILSDTSSEQLLWLASAIDETSSLSNGQTEGYYDTLFNSFLFFPDGLSFIFGTGLPPEIASKHNSDVGYIRNLWQFGLVGSFLLYAFYFKMFIMAIKRLDWPDTSLMRTIAIMISIYLVKLTCFGYSQASVIFGPLCILAIYNGVLRRVNAKHILFEKAQG